MEKKLRNSPFVADPSTKPCKGCDVGGDYYHTADIVQVIEDNQIKLKVVDNKEKISDVIDANADKAGLKNVLKLYAKTGDVSLFSARPILNNFDATNIPTESVDELSKKLPPDLVGDDIGEFLKTITADKLVEFYKSQKKKDSEVNANEQEK